jgi:hypothetical protein
MKKLCLLFVIVFACGVSMAGKWSDAENYYDNSDVTCTFNLPGNIRAKQFVWQLTTPRWRVMAQGQVNREENKSVVKVPLKFDELKPGISLKCSLQIKLAGKVIAQQKIIIYSKKIFKNFGAKFKNVGVNAELPEDEIAALNELGMGLPEKSSSAFQGGENKFMFCLAKKYLDNIDMLSELMVNGVTLVMFAPADESEIFLPLKDFSKISLISSKSAKIKGSLGVICNKEKLSVACESGQGALIKIEYGKGRIIIVADSVYKNLGKTPDAAIILKKSLNK